jgi:uncharacterized membrane protein YGL010W
MKKDSKLMDMLTGYASAHQHPVNVAVHLIGIPTIMLGVFIVFSWMNVTANGFSFNGAHVAVVILFVFYLTLDIAFSLAFLVYAVPVAWIATVIGEQPTSVSGTVAAIAFFGGYAAQFVGHAIEKSAPVILKHPIQANLAAPFFTVVEVFKIVGLRDELFNEVQRRIAELRQEQAA